MPHFERRSGAASRCQLRLFDDLLERHWAGDVAGHAHRRSGAPVECQGVVGISLRLAVLTRAADTIVSGPVPLHVARNLGIDAMRAGLVGNGDTIANIITCVEKFFDYARLHGMETLEDLGAPLIEAFIVRPVRTGHTYRDPAPSTVHNRRWEIGELFDTLRRIGLWHGPVLFGDPVQHKDGDARRPLTDREMHHVRVHAYNWLLPTRRPIVVALSEAGGSAAEIAAVEASDIDLERSTVTFRGASPRTNPIPPEALTALSRALADGAAVGTRRLAVGDDLEPNAAKRSVTQELSTTMRHAGLSTVPEVSGRSIRLHRALIVFHAGGIGAAVRFLGAVSVDTTMRSLGLTIGDL